MYSLFSNNTLNCTLWESYVEQFIKFNQDRDNSSGPTVLLLQYAKVKQEGWLVYSVIIKLFIFGHSDLRPVFVDVGKFPLSVTNTYNVTLLCLDVGFPSIKDFIDWYILCINSMVSIDMLDFSCYCVNIFLIHLFM